MFRVKEVPFKICIIYRGGTHSIYGCTYIYIKLHPYIHCNIILYKIINKLVKNKKYISIIKYLYYSISFLKNE